ncbi:MAG: endolytic transglycosylase MltG [Pyrinomonadaceae bacterium]|nr:endolytic transglycosylase MltG [Pyrinomonadaceae bacterium]
MKPLRVISLLFVLLLITGFGIDLWFRHEFHTPFAHNHASQYIEVPRGSSPGEIVERLAATGIIKHAWPLRIYIKAKGADSRLKAGEYRFPSPISPQQVLQKLEEGQQRLNRFTVIEGWTRWDVAAAMARLPEFQLQSADEALRLMDDVNLITDLDPQATNLEGYLYPDTYTFPPDTSAREMVTIMVRRFREVWKEKSAIQSNVANRPLREVATVASLIETEAKLKEERPLVASVIYNRLQTGIPLGIDSTVIYAAKLAGKWKADGKVYQSDLDRASPYNTRKVHGLPPGPIASFGARSLEAALNPATTDYLYYVRDPARDDGAHNFYNNDIDFNRGVQALREWERNRNSNE